MTERDPPPSPTTVVVVGAGMAGARAAETLRAEGFEGRLVLLGEEPVRPYDRVPLSKHHLRGEPGSPHPLFIHEASFYGDHDIELRVDERVATLDPGGREVALASGERLGYDALLLATGAEPRRLPVPGADLDGVHHLRTLADSDALREGIRAASRVVVIGAGWIGCEVAASARSMGTEVALVGSSRLPLRVLGPELGGLYRDVHADHGVQLHLGVGVEALLGGDRVEAVRLTDGRVVSTDLVVVGVGAEPRVDLAQRAGIAVENGIVTDACLATSAPGVFAAGDVANAWHPVLGRRLRLEHWSAALNQGPAAARNMLGFDAAYDRVPFFFSDQYDVGMEYSGDATGSDRLVLRGDPASREFIAFWLRQEHLVAGMNLNIWGVRDTIAALVASRRPVDDTALADPQVALADLLPGG